LLETKISSDNNGNKKCSQEKITDNEKTLWREKKREFQRKGEIN